MSKKKFAVKIYRAKQYQTAVDFRHYWQAWLFKRLLNRSVLHKSRVNP